MSEDTIAKDLIQIKVVESEETPLSLASWEIKLRYGNQFFIYDKEETEDIITYLVTAKLWTPVEYPERTDTGFLLFDLGNTPIAKIEIDKTKKEVKNYTLVSEVRNNIRDLRNESYKSLVRLYFRQTKRTEREFFITKLKTTSIRRLIIGLLTSNKYSGKIHPSVKNHLQGLIELKIVVVRDDGIYIGDTLGALIDEKRPSTTGKRFSQYVGEIMKEVLFLLHDYYTEYDPDRLYAFSTIPYEIISIVIEYCIINQGIYSIPVYYAFKKWIDMKSYTDNNINFLNFKDYLVELDELGIITYHGLDNVIDADQTTIDQIISRINNKYSNLISNIRANKVFRPWNQILQ